jgi:hypothetical protein
VSIIVKSSASSSIIPSNADAVRRGFPGAGTEVAKVRETHRQADAARLRLLILAAAPLTGLLPGSVQSRWETELGVPAVRLTLLSVLVPFIKGTGEDGEDRIPGIREADTRGGYEGRS